MTSLAKYAIFVLFATLAVIVLDHSAAGKLESLSSPIPLTIIHLFSGAPVDAVDRGNLHIGKVQIIYDILNSTYTISTSVSNPISISIV